MIFIVSLFVIKIRINTCLCKFFSFSQSITVLKKNRKISGPSAVFGLWQSQSNSRFDAEKSMPDISYTDILYWPGRVAQSVGHLTRKSGSWVRYLVWQHPFVSPSAFSRRAVVSYWQRYVHEVLVNRLGSLSLPRKSVVRLTDHPDMTLDVYHGHKTTIQQILLY